jgi:hypothetical protein
MAVIDMTHPIEESPWSPRTLLAAARAAGWDHLIYSSSLYGSTVEHVWRHRDLTRGTEVSAEVYEGDVSNVKIKVSTPGRDVDEIQLTVRNGDVSFLVGALTIAGLLPERAAPVQPARLGRDPWDHATAALPTLDALARMRAAA